MQESLPHFMNLAARGAWPGASSGSVAACRLAWALREHAPALDSKAHVGLMEFACWCREEPTAALDWFEQFARREEP